MTAVDDAGAVLRAAPVLIVPWLLARRAARAPVRSGAEAERDTVVLSAGAAIQTLLLALSAQGLASRWVGSSIVFQRGGSGRTRPRRRVARAGHGRLRPAPAERPIIPHRPGRCSAIVDYR